MSSIYLVVTTPLLWTRQITKALLRKLRSNQCNDKAWRFYFLSNTGTRHVVGHPFRYAIHLLGDSYCIKDIDRWWVLFIRFSPRRAVVDNRDNEGIASESWDQIKWLVQPTSVHVFPNCILDAQTHSIIWKAGCSKLVVLMYWKLRVNVTLLLQLMASVHMLQKLIVSPSTSYFLSMYGNSPSGIWL